MINELRVKKAQLFSSDSSRLLGLLRMRDVHIPAMLCKSERAEKRERLPHLRGRVYTHCGAICCCMGLPRASPVNPPKQAQAAKDGATMCVYPAPQHQIKNIQAVLLEVGKFPKFGKFEGFIGTKF